MPASLPFMHCFYLFHDLCLSIRDGEANHILNIYVCIYLRMSTKTKITLSLDKEIVEQIRRELASGETLSGVVEKSLESLSASLLLEKISSLVDLEREILSPKDILKRRGKGARAEEVVREIREGA